MPLETATYISDLNVANPAHTDGLSQADSQMRLLKSTIKATFPNFTAAALVSTQSQIDTAVAGALLTLLRSGTVPPGAMMDFGMATAPAGWLACDAQAISRTTYADLFTAIGTTWGAGDGSTTFNVPPAVSRYRRHRGSFAGAVGTLQSPLNLSHAHTASGTSGSNGVDHGHPYSGTTGAMNANASHTHGVTSVGNPVLLNVGAGGGSTFFGGGAASATLASSFSINATNTDHGHTFSGTTSAADRSLAHTHSISLTTDATGDANESRPYSMSVLTCIKT